MTLVLLALGLATGFAPLSVLAQGSATFAASPLIFAPQSARGQQVQAVGIKVLTASAIGSIAVPLGFKGSPEFYVIGQSGCTVDGVTVNAAGTVCTVTISFRASGPGVRHGVLQIVDGAGNAAVVGMTGIGYGAQAALIPSAATVIAGLGPASPGYAGDGDAASAAALNTPMGLASDVYGNLYSADTGNNTVRMLDAFGNITTVAGGGITAGAAADGGPATAASLLQPTYLATDAAGNLYIAESGSNVIRRVAMSTTRKISTFAGSYVAGGSDGTSATTATLNNPQGIAVDASGNLYLSDSGNNRIRRVDAASGLISTVAGTGDSGFDTGSVEKTSAHFNQPTGLALDVSGNLYVSDAGNHAVRRIGLATVTTVAGTGTAGIAGDGGAATAATLRTPGGLALDAAGNLYIADAAAGDVRKVQASDGVIETVAGQAKDAGSYTAGISVATSTRMNLPTGLAFDSLQNLYVADTGNNVVRLIPPAPGELAYALQAPGNTSTPLTEKIANIGNAPLTVTNIAGVDDPTRNNFVFTNASACTGAVVAAGSYCSFTVAFAPQASGPVTGQINVTDDSYFNGIQNLYLLGGQPAPLTIGPATIPQAFPGTSYYQIITGSGGVGAITLIESGAMPAGISATVIGSNLILNGTSTAAGNYPFTVYATDAFGDTATQAYSFNLGPAPISFALNESIGVVDAVTTIVPLVINIAESIGVVDNLTTLAPLSIVVTETIGVNDVQQSTVTGKPGQLITAPAIGTHTYGDAAFNVSATSDSGLPVSVTIAQGNATLDSNGVLDIYGIGTIVVSYTQAGNDQIAAATEVDRTFNVLPASLTVSAIDATRTYAKANPGLKVSYSGYVHGDTLAALGGTATVSTTATINSPAGTYPITPAQGTITSQNYAYTFVPATLTVTGHVAQTITFGTIPNVPLSVANLTLTARSTSGLPISYTVTGPATVSGSTLHLTGTGSVTVTATQAGNANYDAAAPVSRTFTVMP